MKTQLRGIETRERILDAASASFAQNGYEATRVAQICQRAGVTKGAFYYHFPSKQMVFLELLHGWLRKLDERIFKLHNPDLTVPEGLLAMAEVVAEIFPQAHGQLPLFLAFWSQAARNPEIWSQTIAPYRRYRDFFAQLIQAGIAEGSLRQVSPQITACVIVSLAVGILLQGLLDREGTDWDRVTRDGIGLILEGLKRR